MLANGRSIQPVPSNSKLDELQANIPFFSEYRDACLIYPKRGWTTPLPISCYWTDSEHLTCKSGQNYHKEGSRGRGMRLCQPEMVLPCQRQRLGYCGADFFASPAMISATGVWSALRHHSLHSSGGQHNPCYLNFF